MVCCVVRIMVRQHCRCIRWPPTPSLQPATSGQATERRQGRWLNAAVARQPVVGVDAVLEAWIVQARSLAPAWADDEVTFATLCHPLHTLKQLSQCVHMPLLILGGCSGCACAAGRRPPKAIHVLRPWTPSHSAPQPGPVSADGPPCCPAASGVAAAALPPAPPALRAVPCSGGGTSRAASISLRSAAPTSDPIFLSGVLRMYSSRPPALSMHLQCQ